MRLLAIIPTLFSLPIITDYVFSKEFCGPETGDGEMIKCFTIYSAINWIFITYIIDA